MRERISNKMMEKENFNVVDIFGENVFNDSVMQARLPKKVYKKLHEVMEEGKELDLETADVVAHEMKEWAIERCNTLYALVPAVNRSYGRETRFFHYGAYGKRQGFDEFFGKRIN